MMMMMMMMIRAWFLLVWGTTYTSCFVKGYSTPASASFDQVDYRNLCLITDRLLTPFFFHLDNRTSLSDLLTQIPLLSQKRSMCSLFLQLERKTPSLRWATTAEAVFWLSAKTSYTEVIEVLRMEDRIKSNWIQCMGIGKCLLTSTLIIRFKVRR